MSLTYLNNAPTLQVFFENGTVSVPIGVKRQDSAKALLSLGCEWLAQGAAYIQADKDCEVYHSKEDPRAALNEAQTQHGGPQVPALPELRDQHAFVVLTGPTPQFRIYIDTHHQLVTGQRSGSLYTLQLSAYFSVLTGEPRWEQCDPVIVNAKMRGPMPYHAKALAVDIGTTNTCVAYMADEPVEPRLFEYVPNADVIPTILVYDQIHKTGEPRRYSIGQEAALQTPGGDPRRFVRGMKRYLSSDETTRRLEIMDASNRLHRLRVDDVYYDFLSRLLIKFQTEHQRRLQRVKATYPPDIPARGRETIKNAYIRLGITPQRLFGIDEASAAALYHTWRRLMEMEYDAAVYRSHYREPRNMLVFDLGGGTTDVALVSVDMVDALRDGRRIPELDFEVLGKASVMHLGGDNFTVEVLKALKARMALAVAMQHKGAGALAQSGPTSRAHAMKELYEKQEVFQAMLEPSSKNQGKMLRQLDTLADRIIPTAWVRFEGVEADVYLRESAINNFYGLWYIAERIKIALSHKEKVVGKDVDLTVPTVGGEYLQALAVKQDTWDKLTFHRSVDLDGRIRDRLVEGVRAARQVATDTAGSARRIDSIQLVGNSCRLPLVRRLIAEEFPEIKDNIEYDPEHAKSAVVLGACLAAHIMDFGLPTKIPIRIKGLEEMLGWEIGEWNPPMAFHPHFLATDRPSERPTKDLTDSDRMELVLYRRRPGQVKNDPQLLGAFVLTEAPGSLNPKIPPVPSGLMRLVLIGLDDLALIRGQKVYLLKKPRVAIRPENDPFSGVH